jgi:hypothetical protein
LPPLEAWEKVYVDSADFLTSIHNLQSCIGCHGGVDGEMDKEAAHQGVVADPTSDPASACASCHSTEVEMAETSLHQNLAGYYTILTERGADMESPHMQEGFDNHCATCHASCGQCHVSRPDANAGGFLAGHDVKEYASMTNTCMACHGARVAAEYKGLNEDVPGSVHWLEEGMACYECHEVTDYHGDGTGEAHRYDGPPSVSCEECHADAAPGTTDILEHTLHWETVECSVCHVSGAYKSCYSCHVALDDKGLAYYTTEESQMTFKIGRNPYQSEDRPWNYVLVRHIPVTPDTFAYYGEDLLPTFDNVPTWKYATPHNIQRITPQNANCNNCHGNSQLFLTAEDVAPAELAANAAVIVQEVPPLAHAGLADNVEPDVCADISQFDTPLACTGCHPNAMSDDWGLLSENLHPLNYVVEPAGDVIVCTDCHAPTGNFDWTAAGFSADEAAELIWTDYAEPQPMEQPGSGPVWFAGVGLAIAGAAAIPLVVRRNGNRTRKESER